MSASNSSLHGSPTPSSRRDNSRIDTAVRLGPGVSVCMLRRVALLAIAVSGCQPSGPPLSRTVALTDLLAGAELLAETSEIDFGTAAARPHLVHGWSWDEDDGEQFVWSVGPESAIRFHVARPRAFELRFRCAAFHYEGAPTQRIDLALNGHSLGSVEIAPRPAEYAVPVPAAAVRAGANELSLSYGWTMAPERVAASNDRRELAVAFYRLRWVGLTDAPFPAADGDGLRLPAGSEVGFYLSGPSGFRLELHGIEPTGAGSPVLEVVWQAEGEAPRILAAPLPQSTVPIPGAPAGRLALRATGTAGALRVRGSLAYHAAGPPLPVADRGEAEIPGRPERLNVLIYLVDTLRADALGCYGQPLPATPRLDVFAADAVLFENALAQSSWTLPSVATLLTGLRPSGHGLQAADRRLKPEALTLAEILRRRGYQTAAFSANLLLERASGLDQGFERYEVSTGPADALTPEVLEWLAGRDPDRPFLLYVHTIDPHWPYLPPADLVARLRSEPVDPALRSLGLRDDLRTGKVAIDDELLDALGTLYLADASFADRWFGVLLDELRRAGVYDETVIVFLSDHGEELHERGGFGHGRHLHSEVLRTPLIVRWPGAPRPRRVSAPVEHLDLLPTLLDLLGLAHVPLPGRGLRALVDGSGAPRERPLVAELIQVDLADRAVQWQGFKLIDAFSVELGARRQLYRLEDVGELRNVARARPLYAGYLAALGRAALAGSPAGALAEPVQRDESVLDQLRALGYVQ